METSHSAPREVYPELPLMFWAEELIFEFFRRAVPKPNMGLQLFHLMQEAGLPPPECRAESVMEGGPQAWPTNGSPKPFAVCCRVWKRLE